MVANKFIIKLLLILVGLIKIVINVYYSTVNGGDFDSFKPLKSDSVSSNQTARTKTRCIITFTVPRLE